MNYIYLSFGQKKAGHTLDALNAIKQTHATKTRIFYANIMDALNNSIKSADEEKQRLTLLALDENINTMNLTIKALTHGSH